MLDVITPNSVSTRPSRAPASCIGNTVLAKVGAAGSSAMRAISTRRSASAASSAAGNSSGRTLSQGGTPPYGPDHSASSGLAVGA